MQMPTHIQHKHTHNAHFLCLIPPTVDRPGIFGALPQSKATSLIHSFFFFSPSSLLWWRRFGTRLASPSGAHTTSKDPTLLAPAIASSSIMQVRSSDPS